MQQTINLNHGWRFEKDSSWKRARKHGAQGEPITIPHTFQIEEPDVLIPYMGKCAYTNTLLPEENWRGKPVKGLDFHRFSGIYRNVNLIVEEPLHIPWDGIMISTEHLAEDFSEVEVMVTAELINEFARPVEFEVIFAVGDCTQTQAMRLGAHEHKSVQQWWMLRGGLCLSGSRVTRCGGARSRTSMHSYFRRAARDLT